LRIQLICTVDQYILHAYFIFLKIYICNQNSHRKWKFRSQTEIKPLSLNWLLQEHFLVDNWKDILYFLCTRYIVTPHWYLHVINEKGLHNICTRYIVTLRWDLPSSECTYREMFIPSILWTLVLKKQNIISPILDEWIYIYIYIFDNYFSLQHVLYE
jgi:hypothetical protein